VAGTADDEAVRERGQGGDDGGDPACWLHRVCPACGRLADGDPPTRCPGCGAELPAG
jgi:rubrerythrin